MPISPQSAPNPINSQQRKKVSSKKDIHAIGHNQACIVINKITPSPSNKDKA